MYIKVNIVGLSACWKIVGEFLGRISRVSRIIELKGVILVGIRVCRVCLTDFNFH